MHKPKIQIGREDMSRSAHTFLPKNKLVAGMGIGAIAMLAMAGPALSQETSGTDEVFQLTSVFGLNNTGIGNLPNGSKTFFSFDISWVDPVLNKYFLADRNNKSIDILDLRNFPATLKQFVNTKFQGFTGNNDTSGPDGVLTANNSTELWVGDIGGTCFPTRTRSVARGRFGYLTARTRA